MYSFTTRVRFSEIDPHGNLTMTAMMNLLQDCATFHSEEVGYGVDWLAAHHCGWFVTDWQILLDGNVPHIGDTLTISTWGYRFRGMFGLRNLRITREDGSDYARVNSIWVYMDLRKQLPSRIPKDMIDAYGTEPALPVDWPPRKIPAEEESEKAFSFTVGELQLDTNGHMNNSHYIDAASRCVPEDFPVGMIRAEYRKQAALGDEVEVRVHRGEDHLQVILRAADGGEYCVVAFDRRRDMA